MVKLIKKRQFYRKDIPVIAYNDENSDESTWWIQFAATTYIGTLGPWGTMAAAGLAIINHVCNTPESRAIQGESAVITAEANQAVASDINNAIGAGINAVGDAWDGLKEYDSDYGVPQGPSQPVH